MDDFASQACQLKEQVQLLIMTCVSYVYSDHTSAMSHRTSRLSLTYVHKKDTQAHFITTLPKIELQSHLVDDTTREVQVIPLQSAASAMSVQEALFTFALRLSAFEGRLQTR